MVKRALLVGCNYPNSEYSLDGCVNDAMAWKPILAQVYGFEEDNIEALIDTDEEFTQPTGKNIREAIRRHVALADAGDVLFVHFSGHGVQIADGCADEEEELTAAICPTDMQIIKDDDLRKMLMPLDPGWWPRRVPERGNDGSGLVQWRPRHVVLHWLLPGGLQQHATPPHWLRTGAFHASGAVFGTAVLF